LFLWTLNTEDSGDYIKIPRRAWTNDGYGQVNDPPVDGVCKIINLGRTESADPANPGLNTALVDIFHIQVALR
jgi:hypothetical protein